MAEQLYTIPVNEAFEAALAAAAKAKELSEKAIKAAEAAKRANAPAPTAEKSTLNNGITEKGAIALDKGAIAPEKGASAPTSGNRGVAPEKGASAPTSGNGGSASDKGTNAPASGNGGSASDKGANAPASGNGGSAPDKGASAPDKEASAPDKGASASEKGASAPPGEPLCPICLLRGMLEHNEIDRILGAAMMEPDVRIETNRRGFCPSHYNQMLKKGNRLGLALILESHLAEVDKGVFPKSLFGGGVNEKKMAELDGDCYICNRIESALDKMLGTTVWLWRNDADFEKKFSAQTCFCLPHYKILLEYGRRGLDKKQFSTYYDTLRRIEKAYIEKLTEDVGWFCKKFDYRYDGEPWYDSKNAIERTLGFLCLGDCSEKYENSKKTK